MRARRPSPGAAAAQRPATAAAAAPRHAARLPPPELDCPHFASCSGCTLDRGLASPPAREAAAAWFADRGAPLGQPPPVAAHGWRCRARLAVRAAPGGGLVAGLFAAGTHDVVPIPACAVHHPALNAAAAAVLAAAATARTRGYSEAAPGAGGLRYVQLTVALPGDGERRGGGESVLLPELDAATAAQVVLVWGSPPDDAAAAAAAAELARGLWAAAGPGARGAVHSIHHNFQPSPGNRILGDAWDHATGPPFAWQPAGGARVAYAPGAFAQANPRAFAALLADLAPLLPHARALTDLHAGAGAVGLALAARAGGPAAVAAVDSNAAGAAPLAASAAALEAACEAQGRPAPAITFAAARAGDGPERWLAGADAAVVDPPRQGLDRTLLACLATSPPSSLRTLAYIACHFPSLARDGDALLAGGHWSLAGAAARVFFPGADAIEAAAVFVRRDEREGGVG